jgi:hypothetical protein
MMLHLSLLMLVRWCRNIVVYMADTDCLLPGRTGSLRTVMSQEILSADPECQLSFDVVSSKASITLFLGEPKAAWTEDYVSISCSGWMASVAFNRPCGQALGEYRESFFGGAFAACLGNAELFRYLIGHLSRPYRKWHSLWTNHVYEFPEEAGYGPDIPAVDLGRVHLVGCGSIGSSFAYLVPFIRVTGRWLLVDTDSVESQNTSSSLLFTQKNAEKSISKTVLCRDYLTGFGIVAERFDDDYNKFRYSYNDNDLNTADIILCFANENNIWSTIQHLYPPVCFHATTSKSWGVHIGRHIPLIENCLMCTFKDVAPVAFVAECAKGELPAMPEVVRAEAEHTAILPFLAPAAAIMTLAELIKVVAPGNLRRENTTEFNFSSGQGVFLGTYQSFGNCHICSHQEELYERFGHLGKHWRLSTMSPIQGVTDQSIQPKSLYPRELD